MLFKKVIVTIIPRKRNYETTNRAVSKILTVLLDCVCARVCQKKGGARKKTFWIWVEKNRKSAPVLLSYN